GWCGARFRGCSTRRFPATSKTRSASCLTNTRAATASRSMRCAPARRARAASWRFTFLSPTRGASRRHTGYAKRSRPACARWCRTLRSTRTSSRSPIPPLTKTGASIDSRVSFRLDDPALLLEAEPGVARKELRRVAVAQVDEEVRLPSAVGEKRRVHHRVVEARHRAAVEADRACRDDEVGALQRAVAEGGDHRGT